ncbi:DUF2156 domain-containing protein [Leucobacter ruminantium]|nr:DUF2156 domain-containing protein [Leucobacter ruminantium]
MASPDIPKPANPIWRVIRKTPFTILFVIALFVIGIVSGSLFSAALDQSWYHDVATGYPAFAEGRWWTVFTSPFFVSPQLVYLTLLPLVIGGIGCAEWKFGTLRTIGLFLAGHIIGVLGAAGIVALMSSSDWSWAQMLTTTYDVGPSCGAFTCLVFAISTLPSPWRLRARLAVIFWTGISLLYLGHLYDLEHAVSMVVALAAAGWIPAFRHPAGRPTQREWRLIGLWLLIAIGVIQLFDLFVPYDGPLGAHDPVPGAFIDVAIDIVVIALIANGIRKGYRLAWWVAIVLGLYNIVVAIAAAIAFPLLPEPDGFLSGDLRAQILAPAVFWLVVLLFLIVGSNAFRVSWRPSKRTLGAPALTAEEHIARIKQHGGGTISWMTTWDENQKISAPHSGSIAFQTHAGVAIMLGDPIAGSGHRACAFEEFERVSQEAGLIPCAFSVSQESADAKPAGWRSVIVAEDTIVDLPGLEFKGKTWGAVRTAINRAGRENVEFRMTRLADEPWNVLAQVRAISEQWTGDKGLPEMRFTLGTVDEALDPETYVGIAVDEGGNLHGVTSWLPVYGAADPATGEPRIVGWTLDLMRRRDGGFGPVMEFLIASSAAWFSEAGYEFVSLSGAPLVRPEDAEAGPVDQVLERIGGLIEPLYGFKSLHRFKQKFNPRHESLYLLFRDEGDLPRIGIGITRAYLPNASAKALLSSVTASA